MYRNSYENRTKPSNKNSSGCDGISSIPLKIILLSILTSLTLLINQVTAACHHVRGNPDKRGSWILDAYLVVSFANVMWSYIFRIVILSK